MSVPTVHRLLRSLTIAKLVSQDPTTARYGLGPELTRLSNHFVSRHPVATAFAPFAVSLRNQLNATVSIHILVDGEVVCIDQIDADDRGAFRSPGTTQPVTRSAPGRVLLSHAPADHWSRVIEEDPQISDTDRDVWARAELHSCAQPGHGPSCTGCGADPRRLRHGRCGAVCRCRVGCRSRSDRPNRCGTRPDRNDLRKDHHPCLTDRTQI